MKRAILIVLCLTGESATFTHAQEIDAAFIESSPDPEWEPFGDGTRTGECRTDAACSGGIAYSATVNSNPPTTFTTVAPGISPGEYAFFGVVSGTVYEWTLCSSDGGSAPYDSLLTVRNQSGSTAYCFSDDFCGGDDAKIRWTATITGTVRVLVFEYFEGFCNTDFSFSSTLRWRREATGPVCPNGSCEADETSCNCPQDCGAPPQEHCSDLADNDCDLLIDCADSDCASNPACVPAATVTTALSRTSNPHAPGVCDTDLLPPRKSEPHQLGVTQVRIGFNVPPGTPSGSGVTLQQATCAAPSFAPYAGGSIVSGSVAGHELVLNFAPALENARTFRINIGAQVTSIAGQSVEVRALIGDVNHNGSVNGNDRSVVIGAWTSPGGFSCDTDVNSSGSTNGNDRSVVIGAWTGTGTNCAP